MGHTMQRVLQLLLVLRKMLAVKDLIPSLVSNQNFHVRFTRPSFASPLWSFFCDIIKTAPTKKAFLDLDPQIQISLNFDEDYAVKVLKYHTVGNEILPSSLVDGEIIETLHGEYDSVSIEGDGVILNNSTVVLSSHIASNGVVHVIDSVLIPPSLE